MSGVSHPRVAPPPAALIWSWTKALLGLLYAIPAALVTRANPEQGLILAVGVMCAAAVGLPPVRRNRVILLLVGGIAGLGLFVGSLLRGGPTLGVMVALFVLAVLASVTSPLTRLGPFLLTLGLPLVAAGLNIDSPSKAVSAALLLIAGSAYACVISLAFPEQSAPQRSSPRAAPRSVLLDYGVRLGLAAAITIGVGLLIGIDHPGWAATSAFMVGRPDPSVTGHRVTGRAVSVVVGAGAALLVHAVNPSPTVLAVCVAVALALCCALTGSWWYITPAFTSFVVLTMLMVSDPAQTQWWAAERVAGTLFGVATAWVLLDRVPRWRARRAEADAAS